jgi:hypothetical protein
VALLYGLLAFIFNVFVSSRFSCWWGIGIWASGWTSFRTGRG